MSRTLFSKWCHHWPKSSVFVSILFILLSPQAWSLGLGSLTINSNLEQPLDGFIELNVGQADDLNTLNARIASRDEFVELGIDYPNYVQGISLRLENHGSGPVLRVVSDSIINEPFVHFLIRVDWSGGSFLREYTALIDPPVYAANTPAPITQSQTFETVPSFGNDDAERLGADNNTNINTQPYSVESEAYQAPEAQAYQQLDDSLDAQYGPVVSGETLSEIAADLKRQFPDLSIYQIMKVLFEQNQSAFIEGNINGLLEGAVLRIGDINAIRSVDMADARSFFQDHLREWNPSYLVDGTQSDDSTVRVGQDSYAFSDEVNDGFSSSGSSQSAGGDDSFDSFRVASAADTGAASASQSGSDQGEVVALRNQITELETALASSGAEKQELTERISILEGQLADLNRLLAIGVDDAELANIQTTLAEQNQNSEQSGLLGDGIVDLDSQDAVQTDEIELVDGIPTDDVSAVDSANGFDDPSSVIDVDPAIDPSLDVGDQLPQSAPQIQVQKSTGFFGGILESLTSSGVWRVLVGVGALLLGGLALLLYRRRRADEEFEVSMLSIDTNSYDDAGAAYQPREGDPALVSENFSTDTDASAKPEKETSFLTVYSDSDAVVQADEVDPIAEADVYIAYGRDEQAEEVLLNGSTNNPNRADIKLKLLTLYHKNGNLAGFERVAEELYAQRANVADEDWQSVVTMGREVSPENPLFNDSEPIAAAALETLADAENITANQPAVEFNDNSLTLDRTVESEMVDFDDVRNQLSEVESVEGVSRLNGSDVQLPSENESLSVDILESLNNDLSAPADEDDNGLNFEIDHAESDFDIDAALDYADEVQGDTPVANVKGIDSTGFADLTEGAVADEQENSELLNFDSVELGVDDAGNDGLASFNISDVSSLGTETTVEDEPTNDIVDSPEGQVNEPAAYDEARTQYELAKVFVDLGDDEGARKILHEIVGDANTGESIRADAQALLDSISS